MSDSKARGKLYKVLKDGKSFHGGELLWSLPKKVKGKWKAGSWHKFDGKLSVCSSGLHLTKQPLVWWKPGAKFFVAEAEGIHEWADDKCVCSAVRLLSEEPVPAFLSQVEKFIATIPEIKFFHPTDQPLTSWKHHAARVAARVAARDAARVAARDAARDAAWAAARDAARVAAGAAAGDAARAAAWVAARDAAEDAARVAARVAAWDAALYSDMILAGDSLDKKHRDHIKARWDVWQRGYGLVCDVNGVLYTYGEVPK